MAAAGKERSRVLVIGGTGYIGRHIVAASAREGHPTAVLVRDPAPADPAKAAVLQGFRDSGATLVKGDLYEHESLVKAIKSADVVISAVGYAQLADQTHIISAIKEAGNVKRFLPSEYGNDVDRTHAVDPAKSVYAKKVSIRRAIEAEGIPYTYVSSNFFAGRFLPNLAQPGVKDLPTDKVIILGDGNVKGIFVTEEDVGTYTIKAVDDPRTLNKILYLRPASNILSHNELVSLWEKKVHKTFERVYIPEDEVLKKIKESPAPINVVLSISHCVWVKGDHTNFEIEPSFGVEATELYPDVKYTTVDEYLNRLL
uniref:NmrA-like domain-containing protein n=1 Tax=Leersia perrieri TaxID=77586 RepID=A0A0D9WQ60_9ORYZ